MKKIVSCYVSIRLFLTELDCFSSAYLHHFLVPFIVDWISYSIIILLYSGLC